MGRFSPTGAAGVGRPGSGAGRLDGGVPFRPWAVTSAPLGLAALLAFLLGAPPAEAWEVYRNDAQDLRVQLDTTLSFGMSLRTEDRDKGLIWIGHGGKNTNAASINADDGDLNYDQWDPFSALTKGTSELEIGWRNYHAFARATAFYDFIGNCSDHGRGVPGTPGGRSSNCTRRSYLQDAARHRANRFEGGVVGAQFQLLDAYVEGDWDLLERPVNLRVGNQLISWGTSFFYQGINQINPVDVTKLRVPGSEIKEALLPSPTVRLQTEIVRNLGVDAYYQFFWNPTYLDPTGSYFSTTDLLGRGASLPADGSGETQGLYQPDLLNLGGQGIFGPADPPGTGLSPEELIFDTPIPRVRGVPRVSSDEPPSQGQGGIALRYFLEQAQTELGLYYVHFHSKTPVLGFDARGIPPAAFPPVGTNAPWAYFKQYPKDINLVGFSFASEVLSTAVTGEVSFRPDDPVPLNAIVGPLLPLGTPPLFTGATARLDGFEREKRLQFVLNALASIARGTRLIGPLVGWIGANDITFLAEWGLVFYPGLDKQCVPTGEFGVPAVEQVPTIQTGCTPYAGPAGTSDRVDDVSWGYQIRIGPNWFNPLGLPVRLQPFVSWQHDVDGTTPGFNPYLDERKAVNVGVEVIYLDSWTGVVSYANFFGGGNANQINDRDFLSFSISRAF
jgi:hypothetical protein